MQLPQVASSANILQHLETNYADRTTRNAAQLSSKNGQLLVVHLPEDVQEAGAHAQFIRATHRCELQAT